MKKLVPITRESSLKFGDKVFSTVKGNGVVIFAEEGIAVKVLFDMPNITTISDRIDSLVFATRESITLPVTLFHGEVEHGEDYCITLEYYGIETPTATDPSSYSDKEIPQSKPTLTM